jgi:hypothetical protein
MSLKTWLRKKFGKDVSVSIDDELINAYVLAGTQFGEVVNMIYFGECVGFEEMLSTWERTEMAYSTMGFRTLSIDEFVTLARGDHADDLLLVPRKEGEKVVLHAAIYRRLYLNELAMAKLGHLLTPSTDRFKDH